SFSLRFPLQTVFPFPRTFPYPSLSVWFTQRNRFLHPLVLRTSYLSKVPTSKQNRPIRHSYFVIRHFLQPFPSVRFPLQTVFPFPRTSSLVPRTFPVFPRQPSSHLFVIRHSLLSGENSIL